MVVPEKSIGARFGNTPLAKDGFFSDWTVSPQWNLCNAPGTDGGKVDALGRFLASDDRLLVCTHATFRFAFEKFGVEAFDDGLVEADGEGHNLGNLTQFFDFNVRFNAAIIGSHASRLRFARGGGLDLILEST